MNTHGRIVACGMIIDRMASRPLSGTSAPREMASPKLGLTLLISAEIQIGRRTSRPVCRSSWTAGNSARSDSRCCGSRHGSPKTWISATFLARLGGNAGLADLPHAAQLDFHKELDCRAGLNGRIEQTVHQVLSIAPVGGPKAYRHMVEGRKTSPQK